MANLLLTADGDLDFSSNNFSIVTGDDELVQKLFVRLQFFLGEWFLDERVGIPYYQEILKKNPNLVSVRRIFRDTIVTTNGVEDLDTFNFEFDRATRALTMSFTAVKTEGGTIDFNEEFILP